MMNEDDPRLTAYVLGETGPEDSRAVEQSLSEDTALLKAEQALRETVEHLREEMGEPHLTLDPVRRAELYARLGVGRGEIRWWRRAAVISGMAACVCVGLSLGLLLPSLGRWSGVPASGKIVHADLQDRGDLLSFGFHLESEKANSGESSDGFGAELAGSVVQQPSVRGSGGLPPVTGGGPTVLATLPEPSRNGGRTWEAFSAERPMVSVAKTEGAPAAGAVNVRRSAAGGKKSVTTQETVSGVSRIAAAQAPNANPSVWGGHDLASRQRAAQCLQAVSGALMEARWPEPGSFTAADLVSAYADLTATAGAGAKMDFRFAAAVASFGTLLEKPEGADSRRWEEVLEMASGAGLSGELRQSFVGLVESARKLAKQGATRR